MAHAKNAVEDDFLGFPDERHGQGQGQQREKDQQPKAEAFKPEGKSAEGQLPVLRMQEDNMTHAKKQQANQYPAVKGGEQERFMPERFIRQHGSELLED